MLKINNIIYMLFDTNMVIKIILVLIILYYINRMIKCV